MVIKSWAVQEYATKNGAYFTIQPWDFSYYSDKLKTALFNINDEVLKPYFELEKVKKVCLDCNSNYMVCNLLKIRKNSGLSS